VRQSPVEGRRAEFAEGHLVHRIDVESMHQAAISTSGRVSAVLVPPPLSVSIEQL
jgi:hypothetical protein